MTWILIYLAALATFLVLDAIWLTNVMRPIFDSYIGDLLRESIRWEAAAVFYLFYIAGVLYFCTQPALAAEGGGVRTAAVNGAILGFLAFGTYEATNMTTIKGWSWTMVAVDTGWGVFVTAAIAVSGYLAGRALGTA